VKKRKNDLIFVQSIVMKKVSKVITAILLVLTVLIANENIIPSTTDNIVWRHRVRVSI
jgi:hypothetical protein